MRDKAKSHVMPRRALFSFVSLSIALFVVSVNPDFALAANEEAGSSSGGLSTILPDMIEFIPMLLAFIVLWVILAKFGWPAFSAILDRRENTIREALKQSEEARSESERVLAEYKEQLNEAQVKASEIILESRRTADQMRQDMQAQAEEQAEEIIKRARASIDAERRAAILELRSTVANTSVEVASKLIGQDLDVDTHREIIERYINESGSFNGS